MKKCIYCGKEYPDNAVRCPADAHPLASKLVFDSGSTKGRAHRPINAVALALITGAVSELALFILGMAFGHVGPCGPSNLLGGLVIAMFFPPFLLGLGFALSVAAFIIILVFRKQRA